MDEWFCEILDEQLGPMPWAELVYLAERGNLRSSHRVRHGQQGDWTRAGEVAGLPLAGEKPIDGEPADERDAFEIGPGECKGLFQQLVEAPASIGWVAPSREEDPSPSSVGVVTYEGTDLAANRRPTMLEPQMPAAPAADAPTAAIGVAPSPPAPSLPRLSAAATRPARKPAASRSSAPRRDVAGGSRLVKPLIIAAAVAGVAIAGWFGLHKGLADGPPYRDVLRGYELRYQELTGVRRSRPDAKSSRVFAAKFKIGVASLRQRLAAKASDLVGDKLRAAGVLLDSMSATAFSPAGSEGEAEYLQQERQLHDVLASAKTSLGVKDEVEE